MTPQYPLGQSFASLNYTCFLWAVSYIGEQIVQDTGESCILVLVHKFGSFPVKI